MTYHFAGIDLSLTNSGVAVLRGDDEAERPLVRNILSSPEKTTVKTVKGKQVRSAGLLDRRNRIQSIAARVVTTALTGYDPELDDAPVFVIESLMLGGLEGGTASMFDRVWLYGLVVHLLFKHGLVVEVSTTTMKKYATGSGRTAAGQSSKAGVLLALPRMFPQVLVLDDNAADALVLAAMGARALGHGREPSPQRVTASALNTVEWPSNTQRRNT